MACLHEAIHSVVGRRIFSQRFRGMVIPMTINLRSTKFARLITFGAMLLVLACGTITIRIDTEVQDETEIKHNFEMEASGPIAMLAAEEWDPNEFDDFDGHCNTDIDEANEKISVSCKYISQEDLSVAEIGDEGLLVEVIKGDLGDKWEYRATMPNSFSATKEELEDNPFAEGMTMDAIIKFRLHWTVEMPGEIVESNANTYKEGTASFTAKLDDERENFVVVSQQDKGGSCN